MKLNKNLDYIHKTELIVSKLTAEDATLPPLSAMLLSFVANL